MRVRLNGAPPDQQKKAVLGLDAGAHFHPLEALGGLDQSACFPERGLEFARLALADVQNGVLDDHSAALIFAATGSKVFGSTIVRPCRLSVAWLRGNMWK